MPGGRRALVVGPCPRFLGWSLAGADRKQKRETRMKLRSLVVAALGLGLGMAVPAAAYAYQSMTTDTVNFRAGPGVGYQSYGALPAGTPVNVFYCQPGWCRASSFLGTGWVSSSYLGAGPRVYPRPYYPPRYYPREPYFRDYRFGPRPYYRRPRSGLNFYFRWP